VHVSDLHAYVMPFDVPDPLNDVGEELKSQTLLRFEIASGCATRQVYRAFRHFELSGANPVDA
jgi:hypothetical protein